ncbi:MAG: hypothetical protein AAB268_02210 [Elusimicrobiota bacterium]
MADDFGQSVNDAIQGFRQKSASQRDGTSVPPVAGQPLGATKSVKVEDESWVDIPEKLPGAIFVGMRDHQFASPAAGKKFLTTAGVDGCIAVLLVDPNSPQTGLFHFHWADPKETDAVLVKAFPKGQQAPTGSVAIVLGGYPLSATDSPASAKSTAMSQYIQDQFKKLGAKVQILEKNHLTPYVRNVYFDMDKSVLYVQSVGGGKEGETRNDRYRIKRE